MAVPRVILGYLAAWSVAGALLPSAGAAETIALDLLERARVAAQTESYEGQVVVEWHDGRQRQSAQVPVRSAGGVLRFGDQVVGTGANRMVHGTDGWLSLWGHDVTTLGPSPLDKYRLTVEPGPDVAARPTDMLTVTLAEEASRPRERLFVDRASGLLLRREMLDSHGNSYRSVAFTALTTGHAIVAAAVGGAPKATRSREPAPTRDLKAPYKLKSRIGNGYRRVGAYRSGGVVQQYFSDGLHGLSVFEQRGHLKSTDEDLAGEGAGRRVEIAGQTMRAYSASVGEAVVWESDGVVYTAVTGAPWSDLAAAVEDLPHSDPPGRLRRLAQTVVSLFRWR